MLCKEGWGAHSNERAARGSWSIPESKLHVNYQELKAVFLALKEFQDLCLGKIVLVATDNTTVVSYINKEGGMRSGPLCALLWRILTWCTKKQVTLKARHIPGRLNVVADKLSRLGQTIQMEWSLLPEVFQTLCSRWHRPQIAVDALTLPWEDLDAYAFPPTAILGKVVEKLQDSPCKRIILIAPGWPNMPWFWDLVTMSSQVPLSSSRCTHSAMGGSGRIRLPTNGHIGQSGGEVTGLPVQENHPDCSGWPNIPWFWDLVTMSSQVPLSLPSLPNLLTQPFNQIPHRNLTNLNLHAWLLEPQQSRNRVSLRQWQQELRLLRGDQPDQFMRQSGPFLQSGASLIRWTSGHPL